MRGDLGRFPGAGVPFARSGAARAEKAARSAQKTTRLGLKGSRASKIPPTPHPFPLRVGLTLIALALVSSAALAQTGSEPFPVLRDLSLAQARRVALARSSSIRLAGAKLSAGRASLGEAQKRLNVQTAGGFDPIDGKVRYYLNLDLARLLQTNGAERQKARLDVQAGESDRVEARQATIKGVTTAWYALQKAEAGRVAAGRYKDTAKALHVAADARFKAGQGELSSVLASLRGTWEADQAQEAAEQAVALACLDLAQACGWSTAEEAEAALAGGAGVARK